MDFFLFLRKEDRRREMGDGKWETSDGKRWCIHRTREKMLHPYRFFVVFVVLLVLVVLILHLLLLAFVVLILHLLFLVVVVVVVVGCRVLGILIGMVYR